MQSFSLKLWDDIINWLLVTLVVKHGIHPPPHVLNSFFYVWQESYKWSHVKTTNDFSYSVAHSAEEWKAEEGRRSVLGDQYWNEICSGYCLYGMFLFLEMRKVQRFADWHCQTWASGLLRVDLCWGPYLKYQCLKTTSSAIFYN